MVQQAAPAAGSEDAEDDEGEEGEEGEAQDQGPVNFRDLLGPECVIQRVDKDQKVVGTAKPEEMQHEMMSRAGVQKRLGACAEYVRGLSRQDKLAWAIDLKDKANEYYAASNFEEAAKLYNDCIVALDLEGGEAAVQEMQQRVQLPVCTNLASCMIEMGCYERCIEICNLALSVDDRAFKALYRRGVAYYRLTDHRRARPDLERALELCDERLDSGDPLTEEDRRSLQDIQRRAKAYLGHIRRFLHQEKKACGKMFEDAGTLYADRPEVRPDEAPIDDSDEAIEALLAEARGDWGCCKRRPKPKTS